MNIVLPTIIQGPAYLIHNSYSFFSKDGFQENLDRTTFRVSSDLGGDSDERLQHQKTVLSFTPSGQVESIDKYFPHGPTAIGASVFGATPKTIVIHTKTDTITYPRGAVTKMPPLNLATNKTLFGAMELTAIGVPTVQPTDAAFWRTLSAAAYTPTGVNPEKIKTDVYYATFGASPYDAIGSIAGFEIDIEMRLKEITADAYGLADIILESLFPTAKFIPSNLTQAQIDTLLNIQGADAMIPGQSFSKAGTDLVITSDSFVATLYNSGPKSTGATYKVGEHRFKEIMFSSKETFTSGAADPRWLFTVI